LVAPVSTIRNRSSPSKTVSPTTGTEIVAVVAPGSNVTVPEVAV